MHFGENIISKFQRNCTLELKCKMLDGDWFENRFEATSCNFNLRFLFPDNAMQNALAIQGAERKLPMTLAPDPHSESTHWDSLFPPLRDGDLLQPGH